MAMIRGLGGFKENLKNKVVLLVSDNLTAVSHRQKQGGTHSWILFLLDSAAVSPGREDGFHSQSQVDAWEGTDWGSFSQQDGSVHACRMVSLVCSLQRLISLFLGISVDLFTTFENKRLPSL